MTRLDNTIVSYPSRGKWGSGGWDGNTSGHLIMDLIDTYDVASVFDPMQGSGTTADVCKERGITYVGRDLKEDFDVMSPIDRQRITGRFDMVFLHPPYWSMVKYSNKPSDLSNGPYSMWLNRMQSILQWSANLLNPTGFVALLLADYRKGDQTYFLTDDVTTTGKMLTIGLEKEIRFIKVQHNTNSRGRVDIPGGVRMLHEYVTILRRRGAFVAK